MIRSLVLVLVSALLLTASLLTVLQGARQSVALEKVKLNETTPHVLSTNKKPANATAPRYTSRPLYEDVGIVLLPALLCAGIGALYFSTVLVRVKSGRGSLERSALMVNLAETASALSLTFSSLSAAYSVLYRNPLVSILSVAAVIVSAYFYRESRRARRTILALLG
ncbi:hypothetical protein IG193_03405 [Infirmifilum lucidum]|uniref:Uncharacterized protein n=1 Tax=Infirmifilum lucidum TaxID=2776706 RepID=A0A7L9FIA1_9CREN|nr:hypothetical protein [Infirmifilum lucidum]QOJ79520.1 hypothetical protein IG193_03405 [Infirmifilum lucidum]